MNLLLVDDDESTLAILKLLLRRAGHAVTGVSDAAEGLRSLRDGAFDCLIVDGHMEPVDGFELARRAKELRPELKTVMVSGLYEDEDIAGEPIGRLFKKPVDMDALLAHLREAA